MPSEQRCFIKANWTPLLRKGTLSERQTAVKKMKQTWLLFLFSRNSLSELATQKLEKTLSVQGKDDPLINVQYTKIKG